MYNVNFETRQEIKSKYSIMGENLVNHRLLRYTRNTTVKLRSTNQIMLNQLTTFNYNSIHNVQQQNFEFTNKLSLITCENPINHVYWDILNSNHQFLQISTQYQHSISSQFIAKLYTNQIEMKCNVPRNNSLSNIKYLSMFMCRKKLNRRCRINKIYISHSSQLCRRSQSPK